MSMCVIVVPEFTAKPASPLAADVWVPAKPQHPRLKIVQITNHKPHISNFKFQISNLKFQTPSRIPL